MFSRVSIFVLIIGTASAVTWSNKLQPKPQEFAHMTGCYIKEINNVIPFNESINVPGFCYLIHCTPHQIDYASCGITAAHTENCVILESEQYAPYPDCCPRVKCYESEIPWLQNNNTVRKSPEEEERRFKKP